MIKFVKLPIEAIGWDISHLKSFCNDKSNLFDKPCNLQNECICFIPHHLIDDNIKSSIHKAFLYFSPLYRKLNNYPFWLKDITEEMKNIYD